MWKILPASSVASAAGWEYGGCDQTRPTNERPAARSETSNLPPFIVNGWIGAVRINDLAASGGEWIRTKRFKSPPSLSLAEPPPPAAEGAPAVTAAEAPGREALGGIPAGWRETATTSAKAPPAGDAPGLTARKRAGGAQLAQRAGRCARIGAGIRAGGRPSGAAPYLRLGGRA